MCSHVTKVWSAKCERKWCAPLPYHPMWKNVAALPCCSFFLPVGENKGMNRPQFKHINEYNTLEIGGVTGWKETGSLKYHSCSTCMDCILWSFHYNTLAYTLTTTSYFTVYSREAESIGNEQREADIRPQQGKKIHGLVIGSVLRLPEEVHSMKNINTKPASFKKFTQRI